MKSLGNVLIIGDSYSTFKGYIPEGYGPYYSEAESKNTDVRKVTETWWHALISETGSTLLQNNSWSGSTIGNTGYDGRDFSHCSFVNRIEQLHETNFFTDNTVDTVFVFGGTNDSWSGAPLGEPKYREWTKEDLYCVLPAMCCMFDKLKKYKGENTHVYVLLNSGDLKAPMIELFHSLCEKYGCDCIPIPKLDKKSGHPTVQGMKDIKAEILNYLIKQEK